ncbi:hypothetical protein V8F20_003260 [Naviculisporaceae sp. PSN 640]
MSSAVLLGLRLSPVLLATSSLTFSFSEYHFFKPFLDLTPHAANQDTSSPKTPNQDAIHRGQVNDVLRSYIKRQFPSGFATILTLYPLTWATAIANIKFSSGASGTPLLHLPSISKKLYLAGLFFSVGHMLWGPKAKDLMEEIGGLNGHKTEQRDDSTIMRGVDEKQGDNVELLRSWMKLHVVRSVLVDFPSWVCFTTGFYFIVRRGLTL